MTEYDILYPGQEFRLLSGVGTVAEGNVQNI